MGYEVNKFICKIKLKTEGGQIKETLFVEGEKETRKEDMWITRRRKRGNSGGGGGLRGKLSELHKSLQVFEITVITLTDRGIHCYLTELQNCYNYRMPLA